MSRILVTGGAGYIGSHTVAELLRAGHDIVVYDDLSNGHREALPEAVPLVVGKVEDAATLEAAFDEHGPDAVIHFAGAIEPGLSASEPARFYMTNVVGSTMLANVASARATPVVFSSSCAVYGTPTTLPVTEDAPYCPESLYGETKVNAEQIFAAYSRAYGLRYSALRYFNAAGADASGQNGADHRHRVHLVTIACLAALGVVPELEIYGTDYPTPDGTCQRDYIHVTDLAVAHVLAVEALLSGAGSSTYNVGVGVPHSVRQVLAAVERASGRTIPTRTAPRREGDPAAVWADPKKIVSELGFRPEHSSIEEIAESAWRWHVGHPEGFAARSAALTA